MKSSVRATALIAVIVAGAAVGCGPNKGSAEGSPALTPAAAVAKAAKNADEITSLHYRMTGKVPGQGQVKGDARLSLKPLAMSMKMTAPGKGAAGQVELRMVDKVMYIGGSPQMAAQMHGKKWLKFDMSALGKGTDANQFGAGQANDNPAAQATFLSGAKDVKKVGTETVEGVKTTHYQGTVTLDQLRSSLKGGDKAVREQREKSIAQFEKLGVNKMNMDMWIDGGDHAKQFRMQGAADKGPLDMTITFLDVNKPVTVTAPPAKETTDLAAMMKGAAAGN
ncbi:LppX_LprAFG lipoprotein [Streptomyces sp. NPDC046805]|uniref:LppX_LprAFG lipoprotein n=1 Tax=Streptomyces sp. NPDC046805 TaxID=3155134 RepID=UPI0033DA3E28